MTAVNATLVHTSVSTTTTTSRVSVVMDLQVYRDPILQRCILCIPFSIRDVCLLVRALTVFESERTTVFFSFC